MRKQRGVTTIGWIFLLVPLAVVIYAGIRITPEYLNYYKVVTAMKETATQLRSDETLSAPTIKTSLSKRFDIGYIDEPSIDEIKIAKVDGGWSMTADYEKTVPMFGNVYITLAFDKSEVIN